MNLDSMLYSTILVPALLCQLQCMDYNCIGGSFSSNFTFIFDLNYFLLKLKGAKFLASNERFSIQNKTISLNAGSRSYQPQNSGHKHSIFSRSDSQLVAILDPGV